MFLILVSVPLGVLLTLPKFTSVAVDAIPLFVVSTALQPAFEVLQALPLVIPLIEKVRDGSIVARTVTDSTVTIERSLSSPETVVPELSRSFTLTLQMSAVPAEAVFVGFIIRGACVVHAPLDWAVHPMMMVIVVFDGTIAVVWHMIFGESTYELLLQVILLATTVDGRPPTPFKLLNAKEVAEGEALLLADPGKLI